MIIKPSPAILDGAGVGYANQEKSLCRSPTVDTKIKHEGKLKSGVGGVEGSEILVIMKPTPAYSSARSDPKYPLLQNAKNQNENIPNNRGQLLQWDQGGQVDGGLKGKEDPKKKQKTGKEKKPKKQRKVQQKANKMQNL